MGIDCKILEQGNGFPRVGDYCSGDGQLYRVESIGRILTASDDGAGPGSASRMYGTVIEADWEDCAEGDEHSALIELIDPAEDEPDAEPSCIAAEEHDWKSPHEIVGGLKENPGVWAHGGGVVIREVCMLCGCGRRTDTWDADADRQRAEPLVQYSPKED